MIASDLRVLDVKAQIWYQRFVWVLSYTIVLGIGGVIGLFAIRRDNQMFIGLAMAIWVFILASWFIKPRFAIYASVFLALAGDTVTVRWFPYTKNLSSRESILYISDAVSLSPLEIVLLSGIAVTILRGISARRFPFTMGSVGKPLLLFNVFLWAGLFNGLSKGGDFRAAMFEFRPLLYLSMMYFLVNTYCTEDLHRRRLMTAAFWAVFVQSLLSLEYVMALPAEERSTLDSLTEHGSALGMNLVVLALLTSLAYRRINAGQRWMLLMMSIPIVWVSILSQRRAGFVTLAAGAVLLAVCLFWRQRGTFWRYIPIAAVVAMGYVGAFWNSEAAIGVPAQSVKGVIAPEQLSQADQASDVYRILENLNVNFTIRESPVTGIGFGQPFLRPYKLPDISKFEFNAYLPHNSFLWIWMKTGFFGFATMLYVIGRSISVGAHRLRHIPDGRDAVVTSLAMFFIVMYMIYTYVDIAWDPRNMVLLGTCLSIVGAGVPVKEPDASTRPVEKSGSFRNGRRVPEPV